MFKNKTVLILAVISMIAFFAALLVQSSYFQRIIDENEVEPDIKETEPIKTNE
jgi:hypothetical protein